MKSAQKEVQVSEEGFDLDQLDSLADATYKCAVIEDDEGNPKSGFILASKNSEEYVAANRKIRVTSMMASHKRKKDVDATTEQGASVVIDSIARNDRILALGVVIGWFGFNKGGKPAPFDKNMVPAMFDKSPTWQTRVLVSLENEANFLPGKSDA